MMVRHAASSGASWGSARECTCNTSCIYLSPPALKMESSVLEKVEPLAVPNSIAGKNVFPALTLPSFVEFRLSMWGQQPVVTRSGIQSPKIRDSGNLLEHTESKETFSSEKVTLESHLSHFAGIPQVTC